jgi:hypothetical protein
MIMETTQVTAASMMRVGLLAAALIIVGSCGGSPTRPGEVNRPPPPPPPLSGPTTLVVTGFVRTMPGRWCEGCAVEVMDGVSAGTSVLTDAHGNYSLSATVAVAGSRVTLQASKNGYLPAMQTTSGGFASFELESSHPLDLTGTYAMTVEAGAQCTELTESIRKRESIVTLAGHPERPRSVFVARPIDGAFNTFAMTWRVSDKEVSMDAASGDGGEIPGIVERLDSDEIVQLGLFSSPIEITATASIRIPAFGFVSYCKGGIGCTTCWSNGQPHLLTMTRR